MKTYHSVEERTVTVVMGVDEAEYLAGLLCDVPSVLRDELGNNFRTGILYHVKRARIRAHERGIEPKPVGQVLVELEGALGKLARKIQRSQLERIQRYTRAVQVLEELYMAEGGDDEDLQSEPEEV